MLECLPSAYLSDFSIASPSIFSSYKPLDDWNVETVANMYGMFREASNFNQCLSTWANITQPDVNVITIFDNSGCQDSDPSAWCCIAPSATPSTLPSDSNPLL